jgi:hypothetical protein
MNQDSERDIDDFKHSQTIEVVATPIAYSEIPLTNQVILSAMIIFNLALIYHVKSDNQAERLRKAQSLYQSSWRLVQHVLEEGSKGNPVVDLFAQALLNNLGECSHKLHDYAHGRRDYCNLHIRFHRRPPAMKNPQLLPFYRNNRTNLP